MGSSMVVEATALGAAAVEVAKITISGPRATARLAATGATTRSPGLPTWTMSLLETTVDQAETTEVSTRLSRDWKAWNSRPQSTRARIGLDTNRSFYFLSGLLSLFSPVPSSDLRGFIKLPSNNRQVSPSLSNLFWNFSHLKSTCFSKNIFGKVITGVDYL